MTTATLPPGPRLAPLNMLGWVTRPIPFMERCRARYGDTFTVDMGPPEGKWIFLTRPDAIRAMFTAPADVLHPGKARRCSSRSSARARCCCSTAASTCPSAS